MNNKNEPAQSKNWIYRHSVNTRICHWLIVISFAYLVVSGAHIFLDFPELYWGKVGFQGYPAFFRLADWGISWDEAGAIGDRRWGRNYHFLFAWVFVLSGLVYLTLNIWNKRFYRKMFPRRDEFRIEHLKKEASDHLHLRAPKGEAARSYNTLQKLSYLVVLFIFFPFMIVSGLAQMPAFSAIAPDMIDLFGGRQTARTLHVLATLLLILFVIIHLVEVFIAGAVNGVRSMITGKYMLSEEKVE